MSKKIIPFLKHVIAEINYLLQESKNLEFNSYLNNETLKRSFVRSLEVIGEAAKNVPLEFRKKYSQVQWDKMAGLRDVLIHQYFGIDHKVVWDVVKNRIPDLKVEIEKILKSVENIEN